MRSFILFGLVCLITATNLLAQSPEAIFFDQSGKVTSKANAYYYREVKSGGPANTFVSKYMNGNLAFEGSITKPSATDESKNVYSGICTWYFKNGSKKAVRTFDDAGTEVGRSVTYFESGKISQVRIWENGKLKGRKYEDFDEKGSGKRVFEEKFEGNSNDWDLYASNKSKAQISDNALILESLSPSGTSRYIRVDNDATEYSYEMTMSLPDPKKPITGKYGLIFGFKDWQNYNFFFIQGQSIFVGEVFEGITNLRANGFYSSTLYLKPKEISLKVFGSSEKNYFSINGEIQYNTKSLNLLGTGFGPAIGGKGVLKVHNLTLKEFNIEGSGLSESGSNTTTAPSGGKKIEYNSSGTGFFIHKDGYVVTNHHVVEDAKVIDIIVNENGQAKTYRTKKMVEDKDNDLAILKVEDANFKPLDKIPYSWKTNPGYNVGASVFSIGFPLSSILGSEAKFVDGRISSKTGFKNSISSFQTSVPIQPGNSGSPLFNEKGELIAVMNAMVTNTDNVSYAVKLSFLQNLVELLPTQLEISNPGFPVGTKMEDMVKALSPIVTLIKIQK